MKVRIDGKFVEVTWRDGNDEKTLLITPQDIVKNYHSAQQSMHQTAVGVGGRAVNPLQSSLFAEVPAATSGGW